MEDAPDLVVERIAHYLGIAELVSLSSTCRRLREVVCSCRVWSHHCRVDFDAEGGGYAEYVRQARDVGRYRPFVGRLRRAVRSIEASFAGAGLPSRFRPGASEEAVAALEGVLGPVPRELGALLRVADGQTPPERPADAMLGTATFYDALLVRVLVGCDFLAREGRGAASCPLVVAVGSERTRLEMHLPSGRLFWSTRAGGAFAAGCSLSELLERYAAQLASGCLRFGEFGANLFPRSGVPERVTHGVGVSCSPLFLPSRSSAVDGEYGFAYSIRIFGEPGVRPCQLVSRKWIIDKGDDRAPEVVQGPGVVGEFPKVSPGSEFVYESMCFTHGPGSMRGSFFFRRDGEDELLEVAVPEFHLVPLAQFDPDSP